MFLVKCPDDYFKKEREYIYDVILNDFLGLEYELIFENRSDVCMTYGGKEIFVDDTFFSMPAEDYLMVKSLPDVKIDSWDCQYEEITKLFTEASIPVIYGKKLKNGDYIDIRPQNIHMGIDIFGSSFFMLSRYEEVIRQERDDFGRFAAYSSVAYKNNFLERPIVNEYIELLWWSIHSLYSNIKRKEHSFNMILSHDVDSPSIFLNFLGGTNHYRRLLGDLIIRKSVTLAFKRIIAIWGILRNGFKGEWKYTFDYIMDKSEEHGCRSTFFFMTPNGTNPFDGDYYINNPDIVELLSHILNRGHFLGIHFGFASYNNAAVIQENVRKFTSTLNKSDIKIDSFGGRQHYLRWIPATWQYYENSGIAFDTTLSFADHIGFRCGVCYDYPVFNLRTRKKLRLREYPLIVMDCTAIDYMGLSYNEAAKRIIALKNMCKKYKGNFVVLWHNDMFIDERMNELYDKILNS